MAGVIDIHVHIGGPGDSGSGCRMSPAFIFSPAFAAMLIALKANPADIRDERIREIIVDAVVSSQRCDNAVLLSLDGVYRDGRYVAAESHLVTPNDYVWKIARQHKRVLFGASVHPGRGKREMLDETRRCIDHGAVLFKWIPSSQQIDPEDECCIPFYEVLAREGIPLLCHTGGELAVPTSDSSANAWNDPLRLTRALDMGVKVIAAHCAAPYLGGILPGDTDYFDVLMGMLREAPGRNWQLYGDLSAFCTPTRISYLETIRNLTAAGEVAPERFLFGSDFPIPIIDINVFKEPLDLRAMTEQISAQGNPLDHNYTILKEFGIHEAGFTNAANILRI